MKYLNLFLSIKRVTTTHISWHRHCNDIWGLVNEGVINNVCSDQNSRGNRLGGKVGLSRSLIITLMAEHYLTEGKHNYEIAFASRRLEVPLSPHVGIQTT